MRVLNLRVGKPHGSAAKQQALTDTNTTRRPSALELVPTTATELIAETAKPAPMDSRSVGAATMSAQWNAPKPLGGAAATAAGF